MNEKQVALRYRFLKFTRFSLILFILCIANCYPSTSSDESPEQSNNYLLVDLTIDSENSVLTPIFINRAYMEPGPFQLLRISPDQDEISVISFEYTEQLQRYRKYAIDSQNNVYISPTFDRPINFGDGDRALEIPTGERSLMLLKFGSNGSLIWTGTFEGDNNVFPDQLHVDLDDNLYLVGNFTGEIDLDIGPGIDLRPSENNRVNQFFVKYNSDGEYLWGRTFLTADAEIYLDELGNIYLITVESESPSDHNYYISRIIKMDSSGEDLWARTIDNGIVRHFDCSTSEHGDDFNLYLGGTYLGPTTIEGTEESIELERSDKVRSFVASYDRSGRILWCKNWPQDDGSIDVLAATDNGVIIAGYFHAWPPERIPEDYVYLKSEAYFMKFDLNGDLVDKLSWGGAGDQYVASVIFDQEGYMYIGGYCQESDQVDFDPGTAEEIRTNPNSYISKFNQNLEFQWVLTDEDFQPLTLEAMN